MEFMGCHSLFLKRQEFEHEKEFRLIVNCPEQLIGRDAISININTNKLIKSIKLDPRISEDKYQLFKKIIQELGYTGKIEQSKLYNPPIMNIKLKGVI